MKMNDSRQSKIIDRFPAGVVTPPPSKSLSHRALICAALCGLHGKGEDDAPAEIWNVGVSEDISATRRGIARIVSVLSGTADIAAPERRVDCGESGSTLRFLIPIAGLDGEEWVFTGNGRLMERPLDIYRDMFERAGGVFEQRSSEVRVRGPLRVGKYTLPGDVSSQFVSGLLFSLPLLCGDSEIALSTPLESSGYARMTVDVLRHYGVAMDEIADGRGGIRGYRVRGGQTYRRAAYTVESDYSQAAFFLAAAALGCDVRVAGLNPHSLQGDRYIIDVIRGMGAEVRDEDGAVRVLPPAGGLKALTIDVAEIPDLVPPIAALACYCEGQTRLVNAGRLRIKESDRLRALKTELCKLGAAVRETDDALIIDGAKSLRGGDVDAWGDHRIAMALAVAAIGCTGSVTLSGHTHVSKSYPAFWEDFEKGYLK
ncbi:MAG: 3-phosphoshikimate 1-carboxyvinyltransferase [Clostridiales Family XIII bacterium]|jgi:3-phosphoshikimate 1-carboxyvinyltransferase|nr:3-phosphoshikimate 1-carboxyvinyltransferase [Clostridiales Family XIII bacterium]